MFRGVVTNGLLREADKRMMGALSANPFREAIRWSLFARRGGWESVRGRWGVMIGHGETCQFVLLLVRLQALQSLQYTIMLDVEGGEFSVDANRGFSNQGIKQPNIVTQTMG